MPTLPACLLAPTGRVRRLGGVLLALAAVSGLFGSAPARAVDLAWQRAFGTYGSGPAQLLRPTWVAVGAGQVFVSDRDAQRVSAFEPSGAWTAALGTGDPPARLAEPGGVAVDPTGSVWVVDTESARILRYSPSGVYQGSIGRRGTRDGAFRDPIDVAVDAEGALWVTDASRHDVQRLSPTGAFLGRLGGFGAGAGQFLLPGGIAIDSQGALYVTDLGRVHKFSPDGGYLGSIGSYGLGPGQLEEPTDVAVDGRGRIYVADAGSHRVDLFGPTGSFLASLGSFGSGVGEFDRPVGVGADPAGDVYVSDANNARVVRLGLGPDLRLGGPQTQSVSARRQLRFALSAAQPCSAVVTATLARPSPQVVGRARVRVTGARVVGAVRLSARALAAIDATRSRTHRPPSVTLQASARGSFGVTQPIQRVVLIRRR